MKIVMLSRHGCIRVMKEGMGLIARGHEVHLVAEQVTQFSQEFKTVTIYQDSDQLYNAIRLHQDADIFHAHNEPSWFVTVVKDLGIKAPVILDMHDSNLIRKTPDEQEAEAQHNPDAFRVSVDERNNAQLADGLVFPCEPMRVQVCEEFGTKQPNLVLPSYLPKCFYRFDFGNWYGGLVYEGRIDTHNELPGRWKALFAYSDYLKLAARCKELDVPFHIYTPRINEEVRKQYGEVAIMHQPKPMEKLIKALGGHNWGLVGNMTPHTEWKNALPNKLFEYMAGCVPIVAMHAEESARWVREYDIGIVVDSVEELKERWGEHSAKRANVIKHRMRFVMENAIPDLEKLYAQVIEQHRPMGAVVTFRGANA